MTDRFLALAMRLVDAAAHADYVTALVLVTLAALGVAALCLWTLVVVVKALTGRRK